MSESKWSMPFRSYIILNLLFKYAIFILFLFFISLFCSHASLLLLFCLTIDGYNGENNESYEEGQNIYELDTRLGSNEEDDCEEIFENMRWFRFAKWIWFSNWRRIVANWEECIGDIVWDNLNKLWQT